MALLALVLAMVLGRLLLYGGLGLLLVILITYLRVRTSPAYGQLPDQIVERAPGARVLGAPQPALPEAQKDLDFALLSQAAYDQTPHGKNNPKANTGTAEANLQSRGWTPLPTSWESAELSKKLADTHLRAQVWIHKSENSVAVTFGGTVVGNKMDLISDLRWFTPFHHDEYTETVRVFGPAFAKYFSENIRAQMPQPESVRLYSTGHSLGGGLAQQFAYSLPVSADLPRVLKVFAFDPSPVTGYFSVKRALRRQNQTGLRIDRIYERGEILAYLRSITNFLYAPSAKNPEIRHVRYNLFYTVNPISGHSITELAAKLWDLVCSQAKAAAPALWKRPRMW